MWFDMFTSFGKTWQTLLDVIRNGWLKLNSFDFGIEGAGRLLKSGLTFA